MHASGPTLIKALDSATCHLQSLSAHLDPRYIFQESTSHWHLHDTHDEQARRSTQSRLLEAEGTNAAKPNKYVLGLTLHGRPP